jgi:hypothetical protein
MKRDTLFIGHANIAKTMISTLWIQSPKLINDGYTGRMCIFLFLVGEEEDYGKQLQDLLEKNLSKISTRIG